MRIGAQLGISLHIVTHTCTEYLHVTFAQNACIDGLHSRAQGDEARLLWNSTGSALLALATSDYDPTNKNYYGEQKLFYLAANGRFDTTVGAALLCLFLTVPVVDSSFHRFCYASYCCCRLNSSARQLLEYKTKVYQQRLGCGSLVTLANPCNMY